MNPIHMTEYYLHDWILFILELIMKIVYTILIFNFNWLILSFFPEAARGAIYS